MHIQHEESGKGGRFFIQEEGRDVAEMTYVRVGDERIIIDHTEVDDSLGGQGVGKMLVDAGVAMAREKGLTIMPLCPFAKKVMERTDEYADVLSKS